jgi:hypothetical protein
MTKALAIVVALVTALVPLLPRTASAAPAGTIFYGLTISSSSTDPMVNSDATFPGNGRVFLHLACSTEPTPGGASAMEADVSFPGDEDLNVGGLTFNFGILNGGDADELLLAIPGCPTTGWLMRWVFTDDDGNNGAPAGAAAGEICLVISDNTTGEFPGGGVRVVVDCAQDPAGWDFNHIGYTWGGATPTCIETLECLIPVEAQSWGAVKALYR